MIYKIRQKIFSFGDKFTIVDGNDRGVFDVVGQVFSIGNKLTIYDIDGRETLYIEQKLFKLLAEYEIYNEGQNVALVKQQWSLFRPKINITSIYGDFTIEGDIISYDFTIYRDGRPVAIIRKELFTFTDFYTVDILVDKDHDFILGLVIVIDQIYHDGNNSN